MKAIDLVRAALLIIAIVLLMRGIDRLRYPKYELVLSDKSTISAHDRFDERPQVKKSVPSFIVAVVEVSIAAVLMGGIGWTIWSWDRSRLGLNPRAIGNNQSQLKS